MTEPLPDVAITAAADAIHFWPAGEGTTCACLPGHPTARYDNDRSHARLALEAAAPALRAQGAAAERARIIELAETHQSFMDCWRPTHCPPDCEPHALMPFADLIRARNQPPPPQEGTTP